MFYPPHTHRRAAKNTYTKRFYFKTHDWWQLFDNDAIEHVDALNDIASPTVEALNAWIFEVSHRTSEAEIQLHIHRLVLAVKISKYTKGFTTADMKMYAQAARFFIDLQTKLNNYIDP